MSQTQYVTSHSLPSNDRQQATTLNTQTLFARDREIVICHRGEHYRLQLTRSDKLILIK